MPHIPGHTLDTGDGPSPTTLPGGYYFPGTMVGAPRPDITVQPGSLNIDPNSGMVMFWSGTSWSLAPEYVQKAFANVTGVGGASDALGYANLAQRQREFDESIRQFNEELRLRGINAGLDSESARRSVLAQLIANRNNTALGVAQTSADVAKTAAQFAANPRDAVAELMYRNQVGGTTPFGDMTNDAFGAYGKALADKVASVFQPVSQDLGLARDYARSIPPVEFFGPEIRQQLGLQPTAAQNLIGGFGGAPAPAPASAPSGDLAGALQWVQRFGTSDSPTAEGERFRQFVTGGQYIPQAAQGGQLDFSPIEQGRPRPGYSPPSSEGGTNLNIHERAMVVGESGHIYATLGEKRPDGTMRAEQLMIKPLKSEVEKDKKLAEGKKAVTESQKKFLASFAEGGTVNATPDDFMQQLSQLLGRLGGPGGGVGSFDSPLPSLRLLAGAPANALAEDPVLQDYTLAGYSALGIDPRTVASTIKKFTPEGIINNAPRVSFA